MTMPYPLSHCAGRDWWWAAVARCQGRRGFGSPAQLVLKMEVLAGQQGPYTQQVKARSTIATPFDERQLVHESLRLALALRVRERRFDGVAIPPDTVGHTDEVGKAAWAEAAEPGRESWDVALADEGLAFAGQGLSVSMIRLICHQSDQVN
jgi:hypothetical protein